MRISNKFRWLVLGVFWIMVVSSAFAGTSHEEYGRVTDAADGTNASNSSFFTYKVGVLGERASGTVGTLINDFWYSNVGAALTTQWNVGDDHITAVYQQTNGGFASHKGYYAVINKNVSGGSPDPFDNTTLTMMASPNVLPVRDLSVIVTWNVPTEWNGSPVTTNIIGYEVYRSTDNVNFRAVSNNVATTNYRDRNVSSNVTYYYALSYIYRGGATSNVYSAGSNGVETSYPPTTPNAIYPTDNLIAIPARPTTYNTVFTATDNIDYDPVVYDVYFGIAGSALTLVTSNMFAWSGDITQFNVGTINRATTYNWKVIARDSNHPLIETEGPTWSFRTQEPGEIDRFEDASVTLDPVWSPYNAVSVSTASSTFEGSYGMTLTGNAASWYIGGASIPYWQDVSTYSYIALSVKKTTNSPDDKISLIISESDADQWTFSNPVTWTGWQEINIPLSVFVRSGSGSGVYDPAGTPGSIPQLAINLLYNNAGDFNATVGFTIDSIRFLQTGSLVSSNPRVIDFVPSGNTYSAPLNSTIRITFSEAMNKKSVEDALRIGPDTPGIISWFGNTLIFTPIDPLLPNTIYNVSFNAVTVFDLNGQALTGNSEWTFNTTGAGSSGYNPSIIGWSPVGTGVPLQPTIEVIFSEGISKNSVIGNVTVRDSAGNPVAGTISWLDDTLLFVPNAPLAANTTYTVSLNSGIVDLDGDALTPNFGWKFTTGTGSSGSAPTVLAHGPAGVGVDVSSTLNVLFSESMNQVSVQSNFIVSSNPTGTNSWVGNLFSFKPSSALTANIWYTASVNAGVLDSAGDAMVSADAWIFKTESSDTIRPNPVTDITPTQVGSTLVITWVSPTDNITTTTNMRFNLYRSTTISFTPSTNIISLTSNISMSVANDASVSLNFYMIKAVDEAGNESVTSSVVFRNDFNFSHNTISANIHRIAIPYRSPYTKASDIVNLINGGATPGTVTSIERFSPTQVSQLWSYFAGAGIWTGTYGDYNLNAGESYSLVTSGNSAFTLVGMHDTAVTISRTYNAASSNIQWISLPYNSPITKASDLVNAINGGTTPGTVTSLEWYGLDQAVHLWSYFAGAGIWTSTYGDFTVRPGEAYAITISGDTNWKPSVLWPQ